MRAQGQLYRRRSILQIQEDQGISRTVRVNFLQFCTAEIERLRALVPAWRDIASAPRDNQTVFLAFCPPKRRNKKIRPGDEHLYIHKCGYDDINDCWFEPDSFDSLKPTHWTPMLGLPS